MNTYDKKIADRFMDLCKFMNVQLKVNGKFEVVHLTLYDIRPRLENILNYMKSVGVDADYNGDLFDLFRDICQPGFWGLNSSTDRSKAVEWCLIVCQDFNLEQQAWRLYNVLPERKRVLALPYLPEHLRAAARITQ
jgi:hypothetical protein